MGRVLEEALQAARKAPNRRSKEELRRLASFALGSSCRDPVHSGPRGSGTVFWNFSQEILQEICQMLVLRSVSSGTTIFQEGKTSEEVIVILTGRAQLQLWQEVDLVGKDRPKAPHNEVIALEGPMPPNRAAGVVCDYTLEERPALTKASGARLLRARTDFRLPLDGALDLSPVSPAPAKKNPFSYQRTPAPKPAASPQIALRREDRLLRPVAEVIQALAFAEGGLMCECEPERPERFQERWQRFQEQVHGVMEKKAPIPCVEAVPEQEAEEVPPQVQPSQSLRPEKQQALAAQEEAASGAILGAVACMAVASHKWRAVALEDCKLLVLSAKVLGRCTKKELQRRVSARREQLLKALGPLKALEEEKITALATAAKTVLYRRGETLCGQGDTRNPQSRLEVLMDGEARRIREAALKDPSAPNLMRTRSSRSLSSTQSATLLPGQAVNCASLLADEPEPCSVVIESAEVLVASLAWSDLVRIVPPAIMEELKAGAKARLAWQAQNGPFAGGRPQPGEMSPAHNETSRKEMAILDDVLHDRPDMVCQSPRQPRGYSNEDGKDLLSSLALFRQRPTECPKVHPALIPKWQSRNAPGSPGRFASSEELWSIPDNPWNPAQDAIRTCDDWGLRKITASKREWQGTEPPVLVKAMQLSQPPGAATKLPAISTKEAAAAFRQSRTRSLRHMARQGEPGPAVTLLAEPTRLQGGKSTEKRLRKQPTMARQDTQTQVARPRRPSKEKLTPELPLGIARLRGVKAPDNQTRRSLTELQANLTSPVPG